MIKSELAAADGPSDNPRIGEKIEGFGPREVRRILVGHYEMRYKIRESTPCVLRVWHKREYR